MTHTMVVGTTEPQDFQLLDDHAPLVGTGLDIDIEFRANEVDAEDLPSVAWLSQATGTVRVTDVESLAVGTYHFRFTLTDSGGKVGYVPNESATDVWRVVRI